MQSQSTPQLETSNKYEEFEDSQNIFEKSENNSLDNSDNMSDDTKNLDLTTVQGGTIEKIHAALRTPDIIKELTEFNGQIKHLYRFLTEVKEIFILTKSVLPENVEIPVTFIKAIRNKIRGEANDVLIANDVQSTDWTDIRQTLIKHYSDPRTEVALIRDLHRTRQGIQTTKQFYGKIMEIQTALIAHSNLHNNSDAKRELYIEMCLAQFIANLKEPLGSNIRSRDPSTISEALDVCQEEENMYYIKYKPPTQRYQRPSIQEPKPHVTFKTSTSQIKTENNLNQPQKKWIPKEEWLAARNKAPNIKTERNINCTETKEEEEEEENTINEGENYDFFQETASDTEDEH